MQDKLIVRGAREHNLKNVTIEIPRNKLVVFTGLSGSGKTSLAFDTIYAEGQRRYVESLSSYARMFLGQMEKPDIDSIEGLSPAISIDQKTTARNPRSTVGTVTEIYDYLRLLYARVGVPHCPKCGREIKQQTIDQMADQVMAYPEGQRLQLLAPVVRERKGEHTKLLEDAQKRGYVRVRIDGELYELDDLPTLDKKKKHTIEIVVDRLIVRATDEFRQRLADSMETAANESGGLVLVDLFDKGSLLFSQNYACPDCGVSIEELSPRMFSFNSPFGACPACSGLGTVMRITQEAIIPDPSLSLNQGALPVMGYNYGARNRRRLMGAYRITLTAAVVIMALGLVLFQLLPEQMLMLFVDRTDAAAAQEMIEVGVPALKTISLSFLGAAFGIINSTLFQATARGMNSLIVSVCRQLVVILPAAWILGQQFGLNAVWYAFPIAEVASFFISYILLWREYRTELRFLGTEKEKKA